MMIMFERLKGIIMHKKAFLKEIFRFFATNLMTCDDFFCIGYFLYDKVVKKMFALKYVIWLNG